MLAGPLATVLWHLVTQEHPVLGGGGLTLPLCFTTVSGGGGGVNEGPEIQKGSSVLSENQNARLPGNIPRGFRLNPA